MFENITRQLSESVDAITYESLPKDAVERIKWMVLDSFGCALAGYISDRGSKEQRVL